METGLDWDMNDTSFMYAYLANAYKSGSLADVYVAPSNSILYSEGQRVDLNYDPEYVTTGEWGIKARNEENTLNYAFNAFYTQFMMVNNSQVICLSMLLKYMVMTQIQIHQLLVNSLILIKE